MDKKIRVIRKTNLLLFFIINLFSTQCALASNNLRSALGMNTNEALEGNASIPFVDLFRLAMPFEEARPWITKGRIVYDKHGWPKQLNGGIAGTRFIANLPANTIPSGTYTVLYDGEGKIQYNVDAKLIKSLPGKDLIAIKPGKNRLISASLLIKKSNPRNYLRNIRILPPGGICMGNAFLRVMHKKQCHGRAFLSFEKYHKQIIFNPDYLAFMKDFKVIRFMNMSGITRNNLTHWHQRPKLSDATWGGKEGTRGVPLEIMVELANQLNVDPWFNLPHKADNGFIQRYATYVKQNLRSNLKAYVEYTNEAWNGIFLQSAYMKQMGVRQRLDKNPIIAGHKYYAKQSVHIFRMWEQAFGGTQRLIRVMGSLTTDQRMSKRMLSYHNAYQFTDALTIGAYLQIPQEQIHRVRSVAQIFQLLKSSKNRYSLPNTLKFIRKQADIAKQFGVDLIAYEGGQHLVAYKTRSLRDGPNPYLIRANKHPEMATLYYQLLQGWKKSGGTLFVAFSAPRQYTWHGSWGIKEHIRQATHETPKYRALLSFNKNVPCWWKGCTSHTIIRHKKPSYAAVATLVKTNQPPTPATQMQIPKAKIAHARKSSPTARISWQRSPKNSLRNVIMGKVNGSKDLAGMWSAHWDDRYLHVRVTINDDRHIRDSQQLWGDDSIEIYIDADASKNTSYDKKNDFHLIYRLHDQKISLGKFSPRHGINHIRQKMLKTKTGYSLETSIPWATLKTKPVAGRRIGFDIQVNDDDTGHERDGKMAWNARSDHSWTNPRLFGELVLIN